jgi:CubicO group peptidase (beta-lactamase class C family)
MLHRWAVLGFEAGNVTGPEGAGGSFAFADPEAQVGFAYAMTELGYHLRDDPHEIALQHACYHCLERIG